MNPPTDDSLTYTIDMEPVGRRVDVAPGTTLLEAARQSGVGLVSLCGGEGWCESCIVRVVDGETSPHTQVERDVFRPDELEAGYRLACQIHPLSDLRLDIPPESLSTPQRLQVEGDEVAVAIDPLVTAIDLQLDPPHLNDLRADATRLRDGLLAAGQCPASFDLSVLADLSERLRRFKWQVRAALRDNDLVAVLPEGATLVGLAVDIGTTKLAAYLLDLSTGATLARTGAMNPQIAFGEDILSRISYTREHPAGRQELQALLVDTLNEMVTEMCAEAGIGRDQIVDAVIVGNTAMHHLFAGLPVEQLGLAPYVPAVSDPLDLRARTVGLNLAPGAWVHLLPNIAGYVGADHVAVELATDLAHTQKTTLAVDIGTNTEITLAHAGWLLCCSCASGPAFEGAHIHDGMRAAPGAIERVQIVDGSVRLYTIDNLPPVGLCGSGILDVVAEMRSASIIDDKGALQKDQPHVRAGESLLEFVLVPADETGHQRDIIISRKDVNEIQLAKAAIRAGLDILLAEAGIEADAIEDFIVAGAFGTYIDIASAIRIGMFPALPIERFRQIGNAAGAGARQALLSQERRQQAADVIEQVEYIELTTHASFQARFLSAMYL